MIGLHGCSIRNRKILHEQKKLGCFYCLSLFTVEEIDCWLEVEKVEKTALCPHCGIDSVVPIAHLSDPKEMLRKMNEYWF